MFTGYGADELVAIKRDVNTELNLFLLLYLFYFYLFIFIYFLGGTDKWIFSLP